MLGWRTQVRFTVGAGGSGMSGRALKMPGRLGRAMFAGAEREFLGCDSVRRDAVIVDPVGRAPPRHAGIEALRLQSQCMGSVSRPRPKCLTGMKCSLACACASGIGM